MSQAAMDTLKECKVVPVIQINNADHAVPLAKTLVENGLPVAEVTFRTAAAEDAIRQISHAVPELYLGAGTVLTIDQANRAKDAGAQFAVAPGLNPTIVRHCQSIDLPMIPGVNNPSQIEQALEMGISFLKFFPAEASGGTAMIKALLAPYVDVSLMPTGGINKANISDYLSISRVVCCGGSWMVPSSLIDAEDWDKIGELVKDAVSTVNLEA